MSKNNMRVIEFLYGIGFSGIILQIVPGIPDYISYTMIVFGLSTAIVAQWRQAIKDRQEHRKDIKEIKDDLKSVLEKNIDLQATIIQKLTSFRDKYDLDHD